MRRGFGKSRRQSPSSSTPYGAGLERDLTFRELVSARVVSELARDVKLLVAATRANKATPGTRIDYLRWLTTRNSYIDPRGIPQTERQVVVPLDSVYVGLTAVEDRGIDDAASFDERYLLSRQAPTDEQEADLAEVLKHSGVVLLGDPGSGKTTILRYIVLHHAKAIKEGRSTAGDNLGEPRLPILIRLADYAEQGLVGSLSSFLPRWHETVEAPTAGLTDLLRRRSPPATL